MSHKILIKFPTRSRPKKFFDGLANIFGTVTDKENLHIMVTADTDDATMYNKDVLLYLKPYIESGLVSIVFGESECKIHAVNRDMEHAPEFDIICVFSDDFEFVQHGWDNIIREKFNIHFPNLDGNLHFYDGYQPRVSTMTIMGKKYWEFLDKNIYEPCYKSLYCDEEYTIVANAVGKMQYFEKPIAKHNHSVNVGTPPDDLLRHTESFNKQDSETFMLRNNTGKIRDKINYIKEQLKLQEC